MTTTAAQLDRITTAAALLRATGPAATTITALGPADARVALRLAGVITDQEAPL